MKLFKATEAWSAGNSRLRSMSRAQSPASPSDMTNLGPDVLTERPIRRRSKFGKILPFDRRIFGKKSRAASPGRARGREGVLKHNRGLLSVFFYRTFFFFVYV